MRTMQAVLDLPSGTLTGEFELLREYRDGAGNLVVDLGRDGKRLCCGSLSRRLRMSVFPSQSSIVDQLEVDGLNGALLAKDALQANTLERIQSLLWMHEMKLIDELQAAATLWPCRDWSGFKLDSSIACGAIHALTLSLQVAYRAQLGRVAA